MLLLGRGLSPLKRNAGPTDPSIKGVVSSCVFDLDATKTASYPGSGQIWYNMVAAPADGSAQSAYNFTLGNANTSSTDDPTFTGSAGSPSAYFALDGGDFFRIGSNTPFVEALHKTTGGTNYWMAIVIRAVDGSTSPMLMATRNGTTTNGIGFIMTSTERPNLDQGNGSASANAGALVSNQITVGTDTVVLFSYSTSGAVRSWVNKTAKTDQTMTYGATSSAAAGRLTIGARPDGTSTLANGTRIMAASMGNAYIGDTEAAKIFALYEARHARDYTP